MSCQAAKGDPLDDTQVLTRIAECVLRGGAHGLRAEGVEHARAFRRLTTKPIIGMRKRFVDGQVFITPTCEDARAVAEAGASVIAVDCTDRPMPFRQPYQEIVKVAHAELGLPVLADVSTVDEAMRAIEAGTDAVATTFFGFTPMTASRRGVSWALVNDLVAQSAVPVVVEGRITTPRQAKRALDAGAYAVVVGAAITQPQAITKRFAAAIDLARSNSPVSG